MSEVAQDGSNWFAHAFCPASACWIKPSILPDLMSALAFVCPCGPPWLRSFESWNGLTHWPLAGSFTHTAGCPFCMGIPSAPGNVPKYESKDRFSCIMTTTCWILWMPAAAPVPVVAGKAEDDEPTGVGDAVLSEEHAIAT